MTRPSSHVLVVTAVLALTACTRNPISPGAASTSGGVGAALEAKGGGGKPSSDEPATAVFRCPGPACSGTDRITGDGYAAPYAALIGGDGNLRLGLTDAARAVTFDYTECLTPCPVGRRWFTTIPATGATGLTIHTSVLVPGTEGETPNGMLDIPVGSTWASRIKMVFRVTKPDGGEMSLGIRFNPFFPGSTNLQVTRVSDDEWIVEATPAQIAWAVSYEQSPKGRPGAEPAEMFEGNYVLPFAIVVTR